MEKPNFIGIKTQPADPNLTLLSEPQGEEYRDLIVGRGISENSKATDVSLDQPS